MMSLARQQIIPIYILPTISRSKGNQAIKFGQLIKYSVRIFFLKNHAENEVGRLVLDIFLFFKKALYEVKASSLQLSVNIFWCPSTWHAIKTNYKTLDYWSRDMLN